MATYSFNLLFMVPTHAGGRNLLMGSSLSGLTYTLSPALKEVATTPSLGFTVNICSHSGQ